MTFWRAQETATQTIKLDSVRNKWMNIQKCRLTTKTAVLLWVTEAEIAAGGLSLFIGLDSDDVSSGPVVANVDLGVASRRVVVKSESAAYVRRLAPYKLLKKMLISTFRKWINQQVLLAEFSHKSRQYLPFATITDEV